MVFTGSNFLVPHSETTPLSYPEFRSTKSPSPRHSHSWRAECWELSSISNGLEPDRRVRDADGETASINCSSDSRHPQLQHSGLRQKNGLPQARFAPTLLNNSSHMHQRGDSDDVPCTAVCAAGGSNVIGSGHGDSDGSRCEQALLANNLARAVSAWCCLHYGSNSFATSIEAPEKFWARESGAPPGRERAVSALHPQQDSG